MSSIFGFEIIDKHIGEECLYKIKFWNKKYGTIENIKTWLTGGMGNYIDHLSTQVPFPNLILSGCKEKAVLDAVLYNREDIGRILCVDDLSKMSDEELLLHLINNKGYDSLATVNGDFAGAIYNENTETWILFRDHMGIRPLFYYVDENMFAFSTDIRGLAALSGADLTINEERLYQKMAGYIDQTLTDTEFVNIHCVPPASWMTVNKSKNGFDIQVHTYWKLGQNKIRLKDDTAYQIELRRLITNAVKIRLDAVDGLVGAELSGGWDSSVISILINRLGREGKYYSWSYSFDDIPMQENDERQVILDICKQENIKCDFNSLTEDDLNVETSLNNALASVVPPYINTLDISKGSAFLAEHGCKVVFTGHSGDEGVSHRCNLYELWSHKEYGAFFYAVYRETEGKSLRFLRTLKRSAKYVKKDSEYFQSPWNSGVDCTMFLKDDFVNKWETKAVKQPLYFAWDPIRYIMQGGSRGRIDNAALQGAENGVRYMFPFLDYRVIDFAVSIPRAQFNDGIENRKVYRHAFDDIVPHSLRDVDYKETPSLNYLREKIDYHRVFNLEKSRVLEHLDRAVWKDYLDFEEIEKMCLSDNYTEKELMMALCKLDNLVSCAMLENMVKKCKDL